MEDNQNYFDHTADMVGNGNANETSAMAKGLNDAGKSSGKGRFAPVFCGIVLGAVITLICFGVWQLTGAGSAEAETGAKEATVKLSEEDAVNSEAINKLQTLEELIDTYYYLEPVSDEKLQDGMYEGIMAALGDPYSEYYTKEELDSIMQQTSGVYSGIGAYVSLDTDTGLAKISGIIENSPAEGSELRANDLIYAVDDTMTHGMTLTEVVGLIKGPEGTEVKLTIVRENEAEQLNVTLIRRKVESPTVKFNMYDNMAYIQVTEFDQVTVNQFADALAQARENQAKGMILDLRANPGGNLDAVVEMSRMILPEGMIVYTETKSGKQSKYTCDGSKQLDIPLVVLVDMNSASASEIMAGAIKDHGIGTLIGTTTFGKGIVQQIIPFNDDTAVKLTISAYYTPNGNNIHGVGIEPDIVCEFDGEAYYADDSHPDNQLEKAKEVLKQLMEE